MIYDSAYIVGFLNKDRGTFEGCDLFSEPCPTVNGRFWPFVIITGRGKDYADGIEYLRSVLSEPWWGWLRKHLGERSRISLGIES